MQTTNNTDATLRQLERNTRRATWILKGVAVAILSGTALMCGLTGQPVLAIGCTFIASMVAIS